MIGRRGSIPRGLPRFNYYYTFLNRLRFCYRGMAPASIINFLSNEDTSRLAARFFITCQAAEWPPMDPTSHARPEETYYNNYRPHQGLRGIPNGPPQQDPKTGKIKKKKLLFGLHNHYYRKAA